MRFAANHRRIHHRRSAGQTTAFHQMDRRIRARFLGKGAGAGQLAEVVSRIVPSLLNLSSSFAGWIPPSTSHTATEAVPTGVTGPEALRYTCYHRVLRHSMRILFIGDIFG